MSSLLAVCGVCAFLAIATNGTDAKRYFRQRNPVSFWRKLLNRHSLVRALRDMHTKIARRSKPRL